MSPCAKLFAVTIDCPLPRELAEFYQRFLGGQLRSANPDFVVLTNEQDVRIDFQRVHKHEPDRSPNPESPRRLQRRRPSRSGTAAARSRCRVCVSPTGR